MTCELLFRDDAYLKFCAARVTAVSERGIELDRTVFYPRGGGQPGDTGELRRADGATVRVIDTRQGAEPESIVHIPEPDAPALAVGDQVTAELNWDRRYGHMRMHTGLHVLCAVLKFGVTGGSIGAERSRLDFDMQDTVDKEAVTAGVNALVQADHPVQTRWITDAELDARPELIRTMSVKPPQGAGRIRLLEIPGVDLQPCGGTHVRNLAEIGRIKVSRIRSEGKRNKRVEIGFA